MGVPRTAAATAHTVSAGRRYHAHLDTGPRLIGHIAFVLGLLTLVDAAWPEHWTWIGLFSPVLPAPARAATGAVVVVSGLLMLRLASGLRRRKQAEWRLAVAVCVALTVADLLRDERRPTEAGVTMVLLVALLCLRSKYRAQADPRSRWFAARVAAEIFLGSVSYGLVLLYLPRRVAANVGFYDRLKEVVTSFVGMGGWISIRDDGYSDAFHASLGALGVLTVVATLYLLLRPAEPIAVLSESDEERVRHILERHGARDSLGYFTLRRDKSVVFSRSGAAAVSYRVVNGVALISGDPVGDPEAWPGAISEYGELIDRYGWIPAAIGCSELGAVMLRRELRLSALELGDEAILHVDTFGLDGREMRGVRQACARVRRADYTIDVRRVRDVAPAEVAELRELADAWRGEPVERGYSMALSRLGDPADPDCVVVTARENGTLRGLLHLVPWDHDGLSLDLMRRDRQAANGLNECMITELMVAGPALHVRRVSLNFAMFRDVLERGERIGAGPVLRAWRQALLVASRWWQIDSLYRFNAKFRPEWQPRYIAYPSAGDLPRIGLAALEAERFLVWPRRLKQLIGRAA